MSARQAGYRLYRGSLVRSLVPIYAIMLLLIAGVEKTYLVQQEQQAYQQDHIFFVHPGETSPPQETVLANTLRRQMLAALKER